MGRIISKDFTNVWVISLSTALASSLATLMVFLGSLVGASLTPVAEWAMIPVAIMTTGTAIGMIPATYAMDHLGRKGGLLLFICLGLGGCLVAIIALQYSSFLLFCAASLLVGACSSGLLQSRFTAMESVSLEKQPAAASMVMGAGIIAAFIGPELAVIGMQITAVDYQGSFVLTALCLGIAVAILGLFKPVPVRSSAPKKSMATATELLRNPSFFLALASASVAYIVMSFVMTGTPISMHHIHGHSLIDTKWVIQSHIAAMFLPSFIAPLLFKHLKIKGMMVLGLICYCATITIGFFDTTVSGFWLQLVTLGMGWNFLFVAGTALLPSSHREEDKFKAQRLNDFTVFSISAIAALSAGWAINTLSWQQMLSGCLIPVILMIIVLIWEDSYTGERPTNDG
jgi:MFS family permease